MGFGIAFLGYCFLLLHEIGFGVLGAPLLAYGFFLASRLDAYFAGASVSALFLLPRGIFVLLDAFLPLIGVQERLSVQFPWLNLISYLLFYLAWFFTILWHCLAVKRIAANCSHQKLQRTATRQLVISTVFILFAMSLIVFRQLIDDPRLLSIAYIAFYVILLTNLFFTHTCLVLITSESQYEKDKELVAQHDREAAARRLKDKEREKGKTNGKKRKRR